MATHTIVAAATTALAFCLISTAGTPPPPIGDASEHAHSPPPPPPPPHDIATCLTFNGVKNFTLPASKTFKPILDSSLRYLRFNIPTISKPTAIILPSSKLELQLSILCARNTSLAIRVRSGGHSYEGLSYTTENHVPFVVIDVSNLNKIHVDLTSATVWAEAGATLGQLYHAVGTSSSTNSTLAFSGGTCSTIGLGGMISGGGFGLLSRKFGLAADNVLDAVLIDAGGNVLTRDTMDSDVFWAIRGGGGGSWGVVYSWKLRLVPVPENITVLAVDRRGSADEIAELIYKWQFVGPHLPDEFYLSTRIFFSAKTTTKTNAGGGNLTMPFTGQFLAPKHHVLSVLNKAYPELRLTSPELEEMTWLESAAKFAELHSVAELTSRFAGVGEYAKRKSDYVQAPISSPDMAKIAGYMTTSPAEGSVQLNPYGGAMARIGSSEIPFPHRAGFLYSVQYAVDWKASSENGDDGEEFMGWLREFYEFMEPFVSRNPRGAYVNYVDLDLGTNNWTEVTGGSVPYNAVSHAAAWGQRYFGNNYDRLVQAKSKIDPGNVFNNAQSIPPLH